MITILFDDSINAPSFEKVLQTKEVRIEGVSTDGVAKLNLANTNQYRTRHQGC